MALAHDDIPESPELASIGFDLKVQSSCCGIRIRAWGTKALDKGVCQGCAHGGPFLRIPPNCPHINDVSSRERC